MQKVKILLFIVLFFLISCKKLKEKGINDPTWRNESTEISYNICLKLESCVKSEFSAIKKSLESYAKSSLSPQNCSEKNKKSRVYLLSGNNPLRTKEIVRECYSQIQSFSCEDIRSGKIQKSLACEEMRKIQQGSM